MKTYSKTIAVSFLAFLALNAQAVTYGDATGDTFTGAGGGILDISSVEVNNTATDLIFKVNVTGNPTATDWGKYMISFDTVAGGDSVGNGWSRPISMSGMDYWVGSWVDGGNGAEVHKYTASWALQSATYGANPDSIGVTKDASSLTIQFKYAGLGITPGTASTAPGRVSGARDPASLVGTSTEVEDGTRGIFTAAAGASCEALLTVLADEAVRTRNADKSPLTSATLAASIVNMLGKREEKRFIRLQNAQKCWAGVPFLRLFG